MPALTGKTDAELMAPWALKNGRPHDLLDAEGERLASFVMNHLVHHRGQLSVYLRLHDVPRPVDLRPSADEGQM